MTCRDFRTVPLILAACLALAGPAHAISGSVDIETVRMVGTAAGETRSFSEFGDIPPTESGSTEALCFELDLVDVRKDEVIGTAHDCLSDFVFEEDGDGISLTDTVIFDFPDGRLIVRQTVDIQPFLRSGDRFTHITGAIPAPDEFNSIGGTDKFDPEDKRARARLSGAVDMSRFGEDPPVASFDCLFVIRVEDAEE
ncbi:MAG: hypothetical protein ACLF0P_11590 [Thermoanaerobaculia bacterium]